MRISPANLLGVVVGVVGVLGWFGSLCAEPKQIVLYRLANASHYSGKWDVGSGLSDKLADVLVAKTQMKVVVVPSGDWGRAMGRRKPSEELLAKMFAQAERRFGESLVLVGCITQFNLNQVQLSTADALGWANAKAECAVEFTLLKRGKASSDKPKASLWREARSKRRTNLYAFKNLESKPLQSSMSRLEGQVALRSAAFDRSFLGRVVFETLHQIADKVLFEVGDSPPKTLDRLVGKVVDIDGDAIYINLGDQDGVYRGLELKAYRRGKAITDPETGEVIGWRERFVTELNIEQVINDRLSKAKGLSLGAVRGLVLGDLVRPKKVEQEREGKK